MRIARTTLAVALGAVLASSSSAQPTIGEATRARARALFEQGLAAFEAQDYPAARDAFAASFELRPNATVLYNLANAQRALYDLPSSIASFRRFLEMEGDGVNPADRAEIDGWIADMESKVARVDVEAPDGAAIFVDGRAAGTAPIGTPILVSAEGHVVTAELEGREPARAEIAPGRGETVVVRLEMRPIETVPEAPPVVPGPIPEAGPFPPGATDVEVVAPAPGDWGMFPVALSAGANMRALDFTARGFADNFYWTVSAGVQVTDWLGVAVDVVAPALDFALWGRLAFVTTDRFRLAAAPGIVVSTGARDDRGAGFAIAGGLLAEMRAYEGLAVWVFPSVGMDTTRLHVVVPLSIGVSYYL